MSMDKNASWADNILAVSDPSGKGSDMPADEFTWTEGSNYGLDGFHYDQTLGEGTRNRGDQSGLSGPIIPAQSTGMSDLPDGLMTESKKSDSDDLSFVDDEGDFDLSNMLSPEEGGLDMDENVRQAASLANLDWLDPTQEQDPERLPKELRPDQPPLNSIPELEEAWGVNRRTDGLYIVPNRDKAIADYEKSIESGLPATPGVEKTAADMAWHIKKAVRMSHYGNSMGKIDLYLRANISGPAAKKAHAMIAREHGVVGKVFVRASAFPGLRNGKWVKELKKLARTARYVITTNPRIAAKLGMEMVGEVPYRKALRQYLPYLRAAGYKVANVGDDARKTLQLAFLSGSKEAIYISATKPVDVRPADRVTLVQAQKAVARAPKRVRQVIARDDQAKARKAALKTVQKAEAAGLISGGDALKLAQSTAAPAVIRRVAETIARTNLMPSQGEYSGVGIKVTAHRDTGRDPAWAKLAQAELLAVQMKKAKLHVSKMETSGQLTRKEGRKAIREATPEMVLKVATAYANSNSQRTETVQKSAAAKNYEGPVRTAALQHRPQVKKLAANEAEMRKASAESGIKVAEFKSMAQWIRRSMSEGMAGDDLTAMMRIRFAGPLRTASEGLIAMLREEHEGLSGHLYVDAAAYASKTGTAGCEKAASKHRTNQVRFVKAMPRCSSCTLANSNGFCTKYGKELLHQLPSDAAAFKKQMLHMADASDYEITASLFNPSEYSLSAEIEVDLNEPEVTEDIGEVLFGGIHL